MKLCTSKKNIKTTVTILCAFSVLACSSMAYSAPDQGVSTLMEQANSGQVMPALNTVSETQNVNVITQKNDMLSLVSNSLTEIILLDGTKEYRDKKGRLRRRILTDGTDETYDKKGNIVKVVNPAGDILKIDWDKGIAKVTRRSPDGETTTVEIYECVPGWAPPGGDPFIIFPPPPGEMDKRQRIKGFEQTVGLLTKTIIKKSNGYREVRDGMGRLLTLKDPEKKIRLHVDWEQRTAIFKTIKDGKKVKLIYVDIVESSDTNDGREAIGDTGLRGVPA